MNPEPWNGEKHIVTMFQEKEEPLQEQLFSCEVKRDSTVVNLVPFNRHFKGQTGTIKPVNLKISCQPLKKNVFR